MLEFLKQKQQKKQIKIKFKKVAIKLSKKNKIFNLNIEKRVFYFFFLTEFYLLNFNFKNTNA